MSVAAEYAKEDAPGPALIALVARNAVPGGGRISLQEWWPRQESNLRHAV